MRKLELLAPGRNFDTARTAIDYGADALYVGGPAFGARSGAGNTAEEVARIVRYARPFGVRVYAALNTLIYEHELPEAEAVARSMIDAGVDALIIQDTAFLRMGLHGVEFHASTQMCNTLPEHVHFLEKSGFSRVILERGLSLEQIHAIRRATGVELECFVHGAICVGFSGQCYLSRTISTRSGNRGDCIQACRLPYDLLEADGKVILQGKHLLSPLDLDLSSRLGDLIDAGLNSFKIEGRLKGVGYVKNVVAYYRRILDSIISSRSDLQRSSVGRTRFDFTPDPSRSFTRGATEWMLDGRARSVACFDTPKATGASLGVVARVGSDFFEISQPAAVVAGDGICFMEGDTLVGTNINRVEGRRVYPNRMDGLRVGVEVFRNYDKAFEDILERSRTRRAIDVEASVRFEGGRVVLTLTDEQGVQSEASSPHCPEAAKDPAKMEATLRTQIAKDGGSIFDVTFLHCGATKHDPANIQGGSFGFCGSAEHDHPNPSQGSFFPCDSAESRAGSSMARPVAPIPFLPISAINALRREALEQLLKNRTSLPRNLLLTREDTTFPHPFAEAAGMAVGAELNVTNSLARQFYRDHGVRDIPTAPDLRETLHGECVMVSAYCIRREIGRCLKGRSRQGGEVHIRREVNPCLKESQQSDELYLRRGGLLYRLEFDCTRCRMRVIKEG